MSKKGFAESAAHASQKSAFGISGKRHVAEAKPAKLESEEVLNRKQKTSVAKGIILLLSTVESIVTQQYIEEKERDAMMIAEEGKEEKLLLFFLSTLKEINKSLK